MLTGLSFLFYQTFVFWLLLLATSAGLGPAERPMWRQTVSLPWPSGRYAHHGGYRNCLPPYNNIYFFMLLMLLPELCLSQKLSSVLFSLCVFHFWYLFGSLLMKFLSTKKNNTETFCLDLTFWNIRLKVVTPIPL